MGESTLPPIQKVANRRGIDKTTFRRAMLYRGVSELIIRKLWDGGYMKTGPLEGDTKLSTLRKAADVLGCEIKDIV